MIFMETGPRVVAGAARPQGEFVSIPSGFPTRPRRRRHRQTSFLLEFAKANFRNLGNKNPSNLDTPPVSLTLAIVLVRLRGPAAAKFKSVSTEASGNQMGALIYFLIVVVRVTRCSCIRVCVCVYVKLRG